MSAGNRDEVVQTHSKLNEISLFKTLLVKADISLNVLVASWDGSDPTDRQTQRHVDRDTDT